MKRTLVALSCLTVMAWTAMAQAANELIVYQGVVIRASIEGAIAYDWTVVSPAGKFVAVVSEVPEEARFPKGSLAVAGIYYVKVTGLIADPLSFASVIGEFEIKEDNDDDPAPPPDPIPDKNPYEEPSSAWLHRVQAITQISMENENAIKLSSMYGDLSSEIAADVAWQSKTTLALREELIKRGAALELKGKYPGLAQAIDQSLVSGLGVEIVTLDKVEAVPALRALAWAVWEAGN